MDYNANNLEHIKVNLPNGYEWAESAKHCPFCGNNHVEVFEAEERGWTVYCDFCNCTLWGYQTRAAVLRQWNHRHEEQGGER